MVEKTRAREREKSRKEKSPRSKGEKDKALADLGIKRGKGGEFRKMSASEKASAPAPVVKPPKPSKSTEEKLLNDVVRERKQFEHYAKLSVAPDLSAKEAAAVSKLASAEAGHVVTTSKILTDRADEKPPL